NGPPNNDDLPIGVRLDQAGNIYVAGTSRFPNKTGRYQMVAYNPEGRELWSQGYNQLSRSPNSVDMTLQDFLVDERGNLFLTGEVFSVDGFSSPGFDMVTACYDHSGKLLWHRRFGG